MSNPVVKVRARIGEGESAIERTLKGREAWTLHALAEAGERGITPFDNVGPRLSHYVFKLRGSGIAIETLEEKHAGPFAGTHGRYIVRTPVCILETERAG